MLLRQLLARLLIVLIVLIPATSVMASGSINISLDNYFYAHTRDAGETYLHNKYGSTVMYGDNGERDAVILYLQLRSNGLGPSDKLYVVTPSGSRLPITDDYISFSQPLEHLSIVLVKASAGETYVRLDESSVDDDSNGGTHIYYKYNGTTPTLYGDLPAATPSAAASPTPTPTPSAAASPTPTPIYDVAPYQAGNMLVWSNPLVNTARVDVYKDGVKVAEYAKGDATHTITGTGTYVIKVISAQGNVIGKGEITITDYTPGASATPTSTPPPSGSGDDGQCTAGCQTIRDMLECPEWDKYMGEWQQTIAAAIPPPPDWDQVADKIGTATVNHFAAWAGDVPAPPSKEDIANDTQTSYPALDTTTPAVELTPHVPADFDAGPIDFSLDDAPTIPVVDESQPFVLTDPLEGLPHDAPGVQVIPGDPANSTGDITPPAAADTGPPPTPGKIVLELPRPSPPAPAATTGPAPTPGQIILELPRPSASGNVILELPRPSATAGAGPIPAGGG